MKNFKMILGLLFFVGFYNPKTLSAQQQSNMGIWLTPYMNNTTTQIYIPFPVNYYLYNDLIPELTILGDVLLFNDTMRGFGGFAVSDIFPYYYSKFIFDGYSDIGIDSGLVLCTGRIPCFNNMPQYDSPGVYPGIARPAWYNSTGINPGSSSSSLPWIIIALRNTQDSDLVAQNNGDSIADANMLEFDFVPKSNHIRLEYVFASEEYGQNSCDSPNDVMGIFLSGPGIIGHQNIALVPNTSISVGLHSIYPPNLPCHPENPAGSALLRR